MEETLARRRLGIDNIFAKETLISNFTKGTPRAHFPPVLYTRAQTYRGESKYMHMRVRLIFEVHFVPPKSKYLLSRLNYSVEIRPP